MPLPAEYFESFEHRISTLDEFVVAVKQIAAFELRTQSRFVWRGAANADWPLYSSLVRRLRDVHGRMPTEAELQQAEVRILNEARDWSLDWHQGGGRLSALELLAALQHYGSPTRMLDFTFSAFVGLWFAVEKHDGVDGRIFAVDISERLASRAFAQAPDPWWTTNAPIDWAERPWIWRPPPFEPRIVRQDGCFLIGGIPGTVPGRNVRRPTGGWRMLRQDEVQASMSVPFTLIQFDHAVAASEGRRLPGRQPTHLSFTLRIQNKPALRAELERGFGYSHASIYPDFPGFTEHARSVPRV